MEKKPSLLIIGFAKSGTSSLSDLLLFNGFSHGKSKEPNILCSNESVIKKYNHHYSGVSSEDTILFDASTSYTKWPLKPDAARAAAKHLSDNVKIIVMYRSPIDRAVSHIKYDEWRGWPKGTRDLYNPKYVLLSMYHYQITRWLRYFSISNFHFIDSDSFRDNLDYECQRLSEFLHTSIIPSKFNSNSSQNQVNRWIIRFAQYINIDVLWRITPLSVRKRVRKVLPKGNESIYKPSKEEEVYFMGEVAKDYEAFLQLVK